MTSIEGNFNQGEAVEICFEKQVIAKGLALYNARDLMLIKGKNSQHIADVLGYETTDVVVHRDDLVLL
ncbi:MAG: glutamate 5-kinase [Alteromonadaceae bacterium]